MPQGGPETILAVDVGSTTTKAVLIEKRNGEYRLTARGETPTTVESPWEDVTIGVRNSIKRVEEVTGKRLLDGSGRVNRRAKLSEGVDVFVATSSAGGGLQMMVAGLVSAISASSAHRAALGAGAVVLDVIAVDDGRSQSEQITRITELRPDIVLMSGGVDGGSVSHLASIAEMLRQANPRPRFGSAFRLPLVYAGNKDAADIVQEICGQVMDVHTVPNLRPKHDVENLGPARTAIHDLFMNHVMAQAPGYSELMSWVDAPIIPTPSAVGSIVSLVAERSKANVMGVDIGGATTDVFSSFAGTFTRTVSANLGMSYSICNVLDEAGLDNILRWVPFDVDRDLFADAVANKMVRPTTIPETVKQLVLEQALAREALRLSLYHHKSLARKVEPEEVGVFARGQSGLAKAADGGLIDMMRLGILIGSGGVLSHAPRRQQAALMLLDAFQPEGITRLFVDSIFMMPHIGVLSTIHPDIALEVLEKDCLIPLGTSVAPAGPVKAGSTVARVRFDLPEGTSFERPILGGELALVSLASGQEARCRVEPARNIDVGAGKGRPYETKVTGGLIGVMLDGRGRPLELPADPRQRSNALTRWIRALDVYPTRRFPAIQQPVPVTTGMAHGGKSHV